MRIGFIELLIIGGILTAGFEAVQEHEIVETEVNNKISYSIQKKESVKKQKKESVKKQEKEESDEEYTFSQ